MINNKDAEFLFRTLGKEVVKKWCAESDTPKTMSEFIQEADDERAILYVLCRISRQLEDVVSSLNVLKRKDKK